MPIVGRSSGILTMLNVEGAIFIGMCFDMLFQLKNSRLGGLPNPLVMTAAMHDRNFIGCIATLRLNGVLIDLMSAVDGRLVKPCDQWERQKRLDLQKHRRRRKL